MISHSKHAKTSNERRDMDNISHQNPSLVVSSPHGRTYKGGSINESGLINNLLKKGFDIFQCLSELIANCVDASATKCLFSVLKGRIKIIDNGRGMDLNQLKKAFDIYCENHFNEKSMGLSGIGLKAALVILSKKSECFVYSHSKNGKYWKAIIPLAEIFQKGKWIGMIDFIEMTDEEIASFKNEHRENMGTTISLPYQDEVKVALEQSFDDNKITIAHNNRFDILYGGTPNFEVLYKHCDFPNDIKSLDMYSPFGRDDTEFYRGKTEFDIQVHQNPDGHFDFVADIEDVPIHFKRHKKGSVARNPSKYQANNRAKQVGTYTLTTGMPRDSGYFDTKKPKTITNVRKYLSDYEKKYFNDDKTNQKMVYKMPILRNNLILGFLPLYKFSSLGGGGEAQIRAHFNHWRMRSELLYKTESKQDNPMDEPISPQENKNIINTNDIPKELLRLIIHLKKIKANKIWEWHEKLVEECAVKKIQSIVRMWKTKEWVRKIPSALANFEKFKNMETGTATLEQVMGSSARVTGWADWRTPQDPSPTGTPLSTPPSSPKTNYVVTDEEPTSQHAVADSLSSAAEDSHGITLDISDIDSVNSLKSNDNGDSSPNEDDGSSDENDTQPPITIVVKHPRQYYKKAYTIEGCEKLKTLPRTERQNEIIIKHYSRIIGCNHTARDVHLEVSPAPEVIVYMLNVIEGIFERDYTDTENVPFADLDDILKVHQQ